MSPIHRWPPRNSTLWRIAAICWLLNATFNGVTASISTTPSVYLALSGINVLLAALSHFVSNQYRQAESLPKGSNSTRRVPMPNSPASELNAD